MNGALICFAKLLTQYSSRLWLVQGPYSCPSTCGNHIRFNPRHGFSVWSSRSCLLIKYDRLYYLLLKWIFLLFPPIQVKLDLYISIHYGGPEASSPHLNYWKKKTPAANGCKFHHDRRCLQWKLTFWRTVTSYRLDQTLYNLSQWGQSPENFWSQL